MMDGRWGPALPCAVVCPFDVLMRGCMPAASKASVARQGARSPNGRTGRRQSGSRGVQPRSRAAAGQLPGSCSRQVGQVLRDHFQLPAGCRTDDHHCSLLGLTVCEEAGGGQAVGMWVGRCCCPALTGSHVPALPHLQMPALPPQACKRLRWTERERERASWSGREREGARGSEREREGARGSELSDRKGGWGGWG